MGVFPLCHAFALTIGALLGGQILDAWGQRVLWPANFGVSICAVAVYAFLFFDNPQKDGLGPTAAETQLLKCGLPEVAG